jgi:hypothetical protein
MEKGPGWLRAGAKDTLVVNCVVDAFAANRKLAVLAVTSTGERCNK